MKIIKYFFEFIIIVSLFCIFKIIGLKNASNLGSILGKVIGPFFRSKNIMFLRYRKHTMNFVINIFVFKAFKGVYILFETF